MSDVVRPYLPLRWWTPAGWADLVLADAAALLADHAHLEREAARNALALMRRAPQDVDELRWTVRLTNVARDEVEHLGMVTRELVARDAALPRHFANPYARDLRSLVRTGHGRAELVDRLLVSGLIELRSCERFALLGAATHELAPFFARLEASEAGHFRLFVQLAESVAPAHDVAARWDELLDLEGAVAQRQAPGPRIHSGMPLSRGGRGAAPR